MLFSYRRLTRLYLNIQATNIKYQYYVPIWWEYAALLEFSSMANNWNQISTTNCLNWSWNREKLIVKVTKAAEFIHPKTETLRALVTDFRYKMRIYEHKTPTLVHQNEWLKIIF